MIAARFLLAAWPGFARLFALLAMLTAAVFAGRVYERAGQDAQAVADALVWPWMEAP